MSAGTTPVTLPPGCYGLDIGGRSLNAKPGGTVHVPDAMIGEVNSSNAARNGLISVGLHASIGTRKGRWCDPCHFLAQAWSHTCPKCGGPTRKDS